MDNRALLFLNDKSGGMNHKSPALLADNQAEMLVDVTTDQVGNIAHRLGDTKYLDTVGSAVPRLLDIFKKEDGTKHFHFVHSGDLLVNGVGSWSTQASAEWNTASNINAVNFIGRHYFASSTAEEWVRWATETGATTYLKAFTAVVSASSTASTLIASTNVFSAGVVGMKIFNTTDGTSRTITAYTSETTVTVDTAINNDWDGDDIELRIDGKYLAVNGAYMIIAGNSVYPRRVYYTNVASESVNVGTDYFNTSEPPTGVASFGNGRAFVIFTGSDYMVADPATIYTNVVEGFGCVSHRSIKNVKGLLVYFGYGVFYALSPNASYPTDISTIIRNDISNAGLMNKIDPSLYSLTAAGVIDDKYYCSVGDLTGAVFGLTLDSCVLEIDVTQNNWKAHTHTANDLGGCFTTLEDSSGSFLYAAGRVDGTVYKMNTPATFTDDDATGTPQAVTSIVLDKHYDFMDKGENAVKQKDVFRLHFRYYSTSTIAVDYSLNGATTYDSSKALVLPIYTTTRWGYNDFALGEQCKTFSLKLSFTGECIIYSIGIEIGIKADTGIKGK